jgi:DNA-binding response OmpR family regulator
VATAADNASAIDGVGSRRAHPFDVVLLDCSVSHMAGSSLPLLLEMSATSAFVVMMAFPTIELEAEALRLGASAVLRKPFALEEVIHLVRVLVEPEPC